MAHARNIPVIVDGAHAFSHFPFKHLRSRLRLLRRQPAQVDLRADRHRLPLCAQVAHREHLDADGVADKAGRTTSASSKRSAPIPPPITTPSARRWCSTRISASTARRRACATCATAGRTGWRRIRSARSCTARIPRNPAASASSPFKGVDAVKMHGCTLCRSTTSQPPPWARRVRRSAHHPTHLQHPARDRFL